MASTEFDPRTLIAASRIGVLATLRASGMPQLSPVTTVYDADADRILVSMTAGRAKEANLRRDPRAAIEFTSADGYTWATAEGTATLIGPSTDPDGPEVDALVDYYRTGAGEHPDWREYREVMVADRRVLLVLQITHVYGAKLR
ncbi:PPOX class F420-dependent oxidoreductase [Tsukamurella sp. DT100]|uniref:PPOX class F420-dependent oxidoreductase n=1 Tax=Tsukamurella sp. DT100 TaxID=3393415 RepID=UPI003CEC3372